MKTTILFLALLLLAAGCSRNEPAGTPPQYTLVRGDLAAPVVITTNGSAATPNYNLEIKLSSAKEAALVKFAQKHPGQDIQIVLDGKTLTTLRMPAGPDKISAFGIAAAFDSPVDAQAIANTLNQLVQ
jgi:ABC-type glycerol-3-phosphate transport system substrate-binding protein